jgi:anti-sigma B factor antagonist
LFKLRTPADRDRQRPTVTDTPFELRSSRVADSGIVEVIGEVDMATAPELAAAIGSVDETVRRVVVNLSEVTFIDSSALNALVHSQRELARREIDFRVVSPSDRVVRKVFEITQLTGPLSVVDSLEDALA